MFEKRIAFILKTAVGLVGLSFAIAFGLYAPQAGSMLASEFSAWGYMFWPVLITLWLSCIPIAFGLFHAWEICTQIGIGNGFSTENAHRLKLIAALSLADGMLYTFGLIVLATMGMANAALVLLTFIVLSLIIAVSASGYALSNLVQRAVALREENELVI